MKKLVFGCLLALIGLVHSSVCLFVAAQNPVIYNGREGLIANLQGNGVMLPFFLALLVMAAGCAICGREAYRGK